MRARNIKPGFFANADLIECSIAARLLFAGLWCLADREGRLEDRPKQIKVQCLPGDSIDVNPLLDELAGKGFIIRYVVDEKAIIQVKQFLKHQRPHQNEKPSELPAYCPQGAKDLLPKSQALRSESLILNPDPLILKPDPGMRKEEGPQPKSEVIQPAESIAAEFVFNQTPSRDDPRAVALEIRAKVDAGWSLPRIEREVRSKRDKSEWWWQLIKRLEKERERAPPLHSGLVAFVAKTRGTV